MKRPFKLPGGTTLGWVAAVMAGGIATLYMPGMPSALGGPEWIIIGVWSVLGIILYNVSMAKYGKEFADEHMKNEIDRIA